jgi:magnesium transporter
VTALLFDATGADEVKDWAERLDELGRHSILWIDLDRPNEPQVEETVKELGLSPESADRVRRHDSSPFFGDFGEYFHVTVYVPDVRDGRTELVDVECLVGEQWVVTVHSRPVQVFDDFRERASGSGEVGRLDGPEFLADLLEWVLTAYLNAFESVELALEEFDARTMAGEYDSPEDELRRLVELRKEVGSLRRALVAHRELFLALTRTELEAITNSEHAERFKYLCGRLEEVIQAARDTRDSIVGSFDVLTARNEQRTNEIVKVLTLGSMLFLPGALIAGVLGMNFRVGLFDHALLFWVVIAIILALAIATLAAARARRWI